MSALASELKGSDGGGITKVLVSIGSKVLTPNFLAIPSTALVKLLTNVIASKSVY